ELLPAMQVRELNDPEHGPGTLEDPRLVRIVSASDGAATVEIDGAGAPGVSGVSRGRAPAVCESRRARVREGARLLRRPLGIRAADVRARGGRKRARDRGVHARLL